MAKNVYNLNETEKENSIITQMNGLNVVAKSLLSKECLSETLDLQEGERAYVISQWASILEVSLKVALIAKFGKNWEDMAKLGHSLKKIYDEFDAETQQWFSGINMEDLPDFYLDTVSTLDYNKSNFESNFSNPYVGNYRWYDYWEQWTEPDLDLDLNVSGGPTWVSKDFLHKRDISEFFDLIEISNKIKIVAFRYADYIEGAGKNDKSIFTDKFVKSVYYMSINAWKYSYDISNDIKIKHGLKLKKYK